MTKGNLQVQGEMGMWKGLGVVCRLKKALFDLCWVGAVEF